MVILLMRLLQISCVPQFVRAFGCWALGYTYTLSRQIYVVGIQFFALLSIREIAWYSSRNLYAVPTSALRATVLHPLLHSDLERS